MRVFSSATDTDGATVKDNTLSYENFGLLESSTSAREANFFQHSQIRAPWQFFVPQMVENTVRR